MERDITKNKDGTFKVIERNVHENITKEQLKLFADKLHEDIDRLSKNVEDLKKQVKDVEKLLADEPVIKE